MSRRHNSIGKLTVVVLLIVLWGADLPTAAAQLQKKTAEAFDGYVQRSESQMERELNAGKPFFWIDTLPDSQRAGAYSRVRNGEVMVHEIAAGDDLPAGLVHDWVAVAFIPGATLTQTLTQLQDYNNDSKMYAPEVIRSKLLERNDGHFLVLLRIKKKSFVTVVLDVTNDVRYVELDPARAHSESRSTRIVEIQDPDTPREHEGQVGDDHGYLWRLNTYWRYWEKDGGVYVQCQAIALTRGIPFGLGWLVKPFVTKIPKESLLFTLTKARDAVREEATNPKSAMKKR